jgi:Predicted transcriptional regulator with C-terminal CBS domains
MNWKTIIQDLKDRGLTQEEIASRVGCSQNYVSDLYNGKRGQALSYSLGQRLVTLHKSVTDSRAA